MEFDNLERNLERMETKYNYFIAKNKLFLPSSPKIQLNKF